MDEQLKKRLLSLAWRVGGIVVVSILNGLASMITDGTINVPVVYVVFIGLVVNEITKYLNRK
jgi:hypothetical protein